MSKKIHFRVDGKPPRKDGSQSLWSADKEVWKRVPELRRCAHDATTKQNMKHFEGGVKITITIHASKLTREDEHEYVGDLDSLVGGILDAIQPAPESSTLNIDKEFEKDPDIGPKFPILIKDDAQVMEIVARKVKSEEKEKEFYEIEMEEASGSCISRLFGR